MYAHVIEIVRNKACRIIIKLIYLDFDHTSELNLMCSNKVIGIIIHSPSLSDQHQWSSQTITSRKRERKKVSIQLTKWSSK